MPEVVKEKIQVAEKVAESGTTLPDVLSEVQPEKADIPEETETASEIQEIVASEIEKAIEIASMS